jgi:hypothetical protein
VSRGELEALVSAAIRPLGREAASVEAFKQAGRAIFAEARERVAAGALASAEDARAWVEQRAKELLLRKG